MLWGMKVRKILCSDHKLKQRFLAAPTIRAFQCCHSEQLLQRSYNSNPRRQMWSPFTYPAVSNMREDSKIFTLSMHQRHL
mmetsp:Transcript_114674/g.228190  ORF Transcript_114674/g.228190 Transcript_114674/m.228190 type:complete len:80 (+) Transcript_114674:130-369(+)